MTKEEMLAAIKECAEKLGRAPTTRELQAMTEGRVRRSHFSKRFGTYTHALELCGLIRHDGARPHSMMELFLSWATVARKVKRVPTTGDYRQFGDISDQCIVRRFGRWAMVHGGMLKFIEREKLEGEWGDVAEMARAQLTAAALAPWRATASATNKGSEQVMVQKRELTEQDPPLMDNRPLYGEPISNRTMIHAPVNEMGVMVLFGAMALDLGFKVLRVQAAFPDCEAMRRMQNGRWQRVLIEFEFESRSFLAHLHDATQCDMIVCWVNNWPECPLEVIELSKLIGHPGLVA